MATRWTCPQCDREFGRAHQAHVCVPGCTVDDTFARRPEQQRLAYDAMLEHLRTQGPVHEDAVSVGVFLKAAQKFAEVRPGSRSLAVYLLLSREVRDPRMTRVLPTARGRWAHLLRLAGPEDVDQQLYDWLDEAYAAADE